MSLKTIIAHLECDGCGKAMQFDLDGADSTNEYTPSLFDLAVDACRGGHVRNFTGFTSVQGESDQCLCPECTNKVDDFVGDDDNHVTTDDEIKEALDRAAFEKVGAS